MSDGLPQRPNAFHQVGDVIEKLILVLQRAEPNFPEDWLLDVTEMRAVLTRFALQRLASHANGPEPSRILTLFELVGLKFSDDVSLDHINKACGADFEVGIINQIRALRSAFHFNLEEATLVHRIVENLKIASRSTEHAD